MANKPASISDLTLIRNEQPDLSILPKKVVEDMWRVGSILGNYAYLERDRELFKEGLKNVHTAHITDLVEVAGLSGNFTEFNNEIQKRSDAGNKLFQSYFHPQRKRIEDEKPIKVNQRVQASLLVCNRLACEMELTLFQMALNTVRSRKELFKKYPLLDCLRRIRNIIVHHDPLKVKKNDFKGYAKGRKH